ncbi:MAG: RCC1 domain-containing protein [Bdellovibrionia bacterium]
MNKIITINHQFVLFALVIMISASFGCNGANDSNQASQSAGGSAHFRNDRVAVGGYHSCGITLSGALKCWGLNADGRVGNKTETGDQLSPVAIDRGSTYSQISAGESHTCGITGTGIVKCWGSDSTGQLGNGSTTGDQVAPVEIASDSDTTYSQIAAGGHHTCAITSAGVLQCWGSDGNGQLGNGPTSVNLSSPIVVDEGTLYSRIAAGDRHTCGITSTGILKCWGSDTNNQIGNGTGTVDQNDPVEIDRGTSYSQISAGYHHTCGITTGGVLKCWGKNYSGQLGDGSTGGEEALPVEIDRGTTYSLIAAGTNHTCGITSTGILKCWGHQNFGALGNGLTGGLEGSPVEIDRGTQYSQLATGDRTTCAITVEGDFKCWGRNTNGQIGDGSTNDGSYPIPISF